MTARSGQRDSRRLSWLLRHGARETNLAMDGAGWSAVDDVLAALGMSRDALDRAVAENDKGRLQLDGGRIRACQGHSTGGVPVTLDALEASWDAIELPVLWHGTSLDALSGIARSGIHPRARTHVHLAPSPESKVPISASKPIMKPSRTTRLLDNDTLAGRSGNHRLTGRMAIKERTQQTPPGGYIDGPISIAQLRLAGSPHGECSASLPSKT